MSYDIPDEIKYKEKIVFGLDIRQLCYACAFTLLAFLSYGLPLQGQAKLILPAFFGILGAGFIIFKLEEKVLDLLHFFRGVRKANTFSPQAHKLVGIRAIENSQITLRDGSLRAILRVEPINFSLLDEGQKSAFVSNYREFLNHLPTPVQMLARTESSDAEEIFSRMQENMEGAEEEIAALFLDFFKFERQYIEKQVVRGRKYYLIVTQPGSSMVGKLTGNAQSGAQLDQKTKIIQEKLAACGLRSERLDTKGLLRFFSTYSMHDSDEEGQEKEEEKSETEKEVKQCCSTRERQNRKSKKKSKNKK